MADDITGAEAAVMIQNALDLPAVSVMAQEEATWEAMALAAMQEQGIFLEDAPLTRAEAANLLYQASRLAVNAPGMAALRQ